MIKLEHEPVLKREVLRFLRVKRDGLFIDATVGAGGHSIAICKEGAKVLGIDWDKDMLEVARRNVKRPDVSLVHANFTKITEVAREHGFLPADGVLFDLGISSLQLQKSRGFSFQEDAPLDMRMNPALQAVTARDLINLLREDQLYELFSQTSPKNFARRVARSIVSARRQRKIERTSELADLVNQVATGALVRRKKIPARQRYAQALRARHPATTIFLALRMAVNSELENLQQALPGAVEVLGKGGRLVTISFHSGEDRIVKNFLKREEQEGKLRVLTKKPVTPTQEEVKFNPRSRSAKLRAAEKL